MHSKVQTSVIWPNGQLILSLVYISDMPYLSLYLWCFPLSLFQLVFEENTSENPPLMPVGVTGLPSNEMFFWV